MIQTVSGKRNQGKIYITRIHVYHMSLKRNDQRSRKLIRRNNFFYTVRLIEKT